jgi:hypothetical protein
MCLCTDSFKKMLMTKLFNGPLIISSTKYSGNFIFVTFTSIMKFIPKCFAFQVTVSPKLINPAFLQAMTSSCDDYIDLRCRSIFLARSKHLSSGALINVWNFMVILYSLKLRISCTASSILPY